MLKALELVGFKSFADKTRFEFPAGITCVVGPNGSGKSNVVDAIKWVLGEQSVKSLRGKEMADCIFNGSSTRPPLHMAETTLVFDNSQRLLANDAAEVSITRRVLRSGEGEYLINGEPARLRDIRDLFSGTGVSTDAYSIIEQGRVDVLLQSSPRDRRMIFEEAAGISRFKAKKIEAQRRLERVEQNMLRLSDIVVEVENRLKSVRQQASKARRYQDQAQRLQELRTQVAAVDWRKLTARLAGLDVDRAQCLADRDAQLALAMRAEANSAELDGQARDQEAAARSRDERSTAVRDEIAQLMSTAAAERQRSTDWEARIARCKEAALTMAERADGLRALLQESQAQVAAALDRQKNDAATVARCEREYENAGARCTAERQAADRWQQQQIAAQLAAGRLASEITASELRQESLRSQHERLLEQRLVLEQKRDAAQQQISRQQSDYDGVQQTISRLQAELSTLNQRVAELRQRLSGHVADLNQLEQRQSGAQERAAVLAELEGRFEGLSLGVKEIMLASQEDPNGPFRAVCGLVADLLRVSIDMAPLVDIALGERAQLLVVDSDDELLDFIEGGDWRWRGRVSFLRLPAHSRRSAALTALDGEPGVLARADRVVETEPAFATLATSLLGHVWVVDQMSTARRLAAGPGREQTFVTVAGELLAPDGLVSCGPRQSAGGLISRRSELRVLRQLLNELAETIAATHAERDRLEAEIAQENQRLDELAAQRTQANAAVADQRAQLAALQLQLTTHEREHQQIVEELTRLNEQQHELSAALAIQRSAKTSAAEELASLTAEARTLAIRAEQAEHARHESEQAATAARIELAKSEERLVAAQAREAQFLRDQADRTRAIGTQHEELTAARKQLLDCQLTILRCEGRLAELFVVREALQAEEFAARDDLVAVRERRRKLVDQAAQARATAQRHAEQAHGLELQASEVRHERTALANRLREDYDIDLTMLESSSADVPTPERAAAEQELSELRRRLNQLGPVNLEALQELEEIEKRYAVLKGQYDDLERAKRSLEQIIEKINVDSRRLFVETLEQVKKNFEALFRKLFGGGQADVALEAGVDLLEAGVEITARPPGKEPRNISLLSGGEKTLTCVALLLAIFQYRPSPFCVLDEVDAALDEANIERFATVLREFLNGTQFIVITHSKKTMTCASTLYGVTMQESGISKRVAVKFEDVTDDGQIRAA